MEKLDILFADLKCPARSPLPKPSIANGTQREINTEMESPISRRSISSACTLTRGAKENQLTLHSTDRRIAREDRGTEAAAAG